MKRKLLLSIGACALVLVSTSRADDATTNATIAPMTAPDTNPWRIGVALPIWASGINGDTTVLGHQVNQNVGFGDLAEHLQFAFALAADVGKGNWDVNADIYYAKLTANGGGSGLFANSSTGLKFVLGDAGLAYRFVNIGQEHPFTLAGTAAARYWYVENTLALVGPGGGLLFSGSHTTDLVQPVIGLRGSQYLTKKLHLDFLGDVGGFDIQHSTDFTWSATGVATYDFTKWLSLSAGYKAVALDEAESSPHGKNGINLILNGALIAISVKF